MARPVVARQQLRRPDVAAAVPRRDAEVEQGRDVARGSCSAPAPRSAARHAPPPRPAPPAARRAGPRPAPRSARSAAGSPAAAARARRRPGRSAPRRTPRPAAPPASPRRRPGFHPDDRRGCGDPSRSGSGTSVNGPPERWISVETPSCGSGVRHREDQRLLPVAPAPRPDPERLAHEAVAPVRRDHQPRPDLGPVRQRAPSPRSCAASARSTPRRREQPPVRQTRRDARPSRGAAASSAGCSRTPPRRSRPPRNRPSRGSPALARPHRRSA